VIGANVYSMNAFKNVFLAQLLRRRRQYSYWMFASRRGLSRGQSALYFVRIYFREMKC
jgi:hypothetical protein